MLLNVLLFWRVRRSRLVEFRLESMPYVSTSKITRKLYAYFTRFEFWIVASSCH